MRLALVLPAAAVTSLIAASGAAVTSGSYNPQYIVLNTKGQVVDVDPELYFPLVDSKDVDAAIPTILKSKQQHQEQELIAAPGAMPECDPKLLPMETEAVVLKDTLSNPSMGYCQQHEMPQPIAVRSGSLSMHGTHYGRSQAFRSRCLGV